MTDATDMQTFLGDLGTSQAPAQAEPVPAIGPVLLSLCFCRDVLGSLALTTGELAVVGMRYHFGVPALPAAVDTGLVMAVWRLPPGSYQLDVGLLASDQSLLAVDSAHGDLATPAIHTSLHRLGLVTFPSAGMYWLAARQNGQMMAFQPVDVTLEK